MANCSDMSLQRQGGVALGLELCNGHSELEVFLLLCVQYNTHCGIQHHLEDDLQLGSMQPLHQQEVFEGQAGYCDVYAWW